MGILDILLGRDNQEIVEVLAKGAVVIDVRSVQEFKGGSVDGSINMPSDEIGQQLAKLRQYKLPLVFCCASGMRSASVVRMLRAEGFEQVYNGGAWQKVNAILLR